MKANSCNWCGSLARHLTTEFDTFWGLNIGYFVCTNKECAHEFTNTHKTDKPIKPGYIKIIEDIKKDKK